MKKILFIFFSSIVTFHVAFSQQEQKNNNDNDSLYRKAAIYGTLSFPMIYCLLNFERQIIRIHKDKITLDLSLSYGGFFNLEATGKTFIVCSNFIFGANKHHFETDIGVAFNRVHAYQGCPPPKIGPCVNICYRIQQKYRPFVFKIGISIPEGAFLSIGFAF